MRSRPIGSSGLEVGCVGLGGMPLSIAGRPSEERGVEVIRAAIDAGMTLIDTADVYCLDDDDIGHNERLVARALRELGAAADAVVVATKGGLRRPRGAWTTDGRPEHLRHACECSLRALGVEAIDLYQLHARDAEVPLADSVGALAELRAAGKIRHVGLSNVSVADIDQARAIVDIASVQNRCNPLDTDAFSSGVVGHCERLGIAFLPHSPVGGHHGHARLGDQPAVAAVAARHGASRFEVCLAFLLAASPVMLPIPGASKPSSARSSARAAELSLDEQELAQLRRAFPQARVA